MLVDVLAHFAAQVWLGTFVDSIPVINELDALNVPDVLVGGCWVDVLLLPASTGDFLIPCGP